MLHQELLPWNKSGSGMNRPIAEKWKTCFFGFVYSRDIIYKPIWSVIHFLCSSVCGVWCEMAQKPVFTWFSPKYVSVLICGVHNSVFYFALFGSFWGVLREPIFSPIFWQLFSGFLFSCVSSFWWLLFQLFEPFFL